MTTPTEQQLDRLRVEVAQICGWHAVSRDYFVGLPKDVPLPPTEYILGGNICMWPIPQYSRSLDVMADAEKTLTDSQCVDYHDHLDELLGIDELSDCAASCYLFHAPAYRRALAFVLVHKPEFKL